MKPYGPGHSLLTALTVAGLVVPYAQPLVCDLASGVLEATPTLRDAQPLERGMAIHLSLRAEQGGAARLKAVISDDASFGDLRAGWIQHVDGTGLLIQDHVLPCILIAIVALALSSRSSL